MQAVDSINHFLCCLDLLDMCSQDYYDIGLNRKEHWLRTHLQNFLLHELKASETELKDLPRNMFCLASAAVKMNEYLKLGNAF